MKNMTLQNIHQWPLMTRILLLGFVFLLVLYLGYRFDLSNQIQKLTREEQNEVNLKQQIEIIIQKNKSIMAEVSRLPEFQGKLAKVKKEIAAPQQFSKLLNEILKYGSDNHLFFKSFTPGEAINVEITPPAKIEDPQADVSNPAVKEERKILFVKVPIKIVALGTYHQIADFISKIANMDYIVAIGNFTISKENDPTVLGSELVKQADMRNLITIELVIDVYRHNLVK